VIVRTFLKRSADRYSCMLKALLCCAAAPNANLEDAETYDIQWLVAVADCFHELFQFERAFQLWELYLSCS